MFKNLVEIFKIFFNSKILNLKGIYLQISGKINGKRRKSKLVFVIGKLPFSYFKSKIEYSFLSKLTRFGSIGIKFWLNFH